MFGKTVTPGNFASLQIRTDESNRRV